MRSLFVSDRKAQTDWISISDLMAGLMMIFLFIAISYMNSLQIRAKQIRKIAVAYQEIQESLYQDLYHEFKNDLPKWRAAIDKQTLSVKFMEPEVLFEVGSFEVTLRFKEILREFFPRSVAIINSSKYRGSIEEIRIEGHTSSEWNNEEDSENAYFHNMKLSQDRTRSVLEFCLNLISDSTIKDWARLFITANGLSSSRLIQTTDGLEDKQASRRVEFRTKTAAEKKVVEIIEEMEKS